MTQPDSKTVLVVEDNPGDARLVSLYLREEIHTPFRILTADTLAGGLDLLDKGGIDVVLLDLSLPDSSGLGTLAGLRAAQPWVPVVVLTGNDDEALALDSLRSGAQDYLVKGHGGGDAVRRAVRYAIERARIVGEMRRSEIRFRAVFDNAGVGVLLTDADGRFIEVNPAFAAMLGVSRQEVLGQTIGDHTHPEDLERSTEAIKELLAGRRDSFGLQKRYLAKDGRTLWARLTVTAVRDEDTGQLRFGVAVVEDITARRKLEEYMRLAATVFENTTEALFITDGAQRIVHTNRAFTDITGFSQDEVLGRTPNILASGQHDADFYVRMWQDLEHAGRWEGEIWNRRKSGETYVGWQSIVAVRDEAGVITNYVSVLSDITSRKEIEERLSYAANHDPLTRLPNRTLFEERLSRAIARATRSRLQVALLFADLDHFKEINDTLGHLVGDSLLQQVADRISGVIRQEDTVARLAGDEFTVILEDVSDPRDAATVAHKILRALAMPFDLGGHSASVTSSIGVAIYPTDAADPYTLIRLADTAMYRSKRLGRNCCQFHSATINAQTFERMALEEALSRALEHNEFDLHYQPIFEIKSGHVIAVEAFMRWHHPEAGMVMPGQFLSLAEETGLIVPIGAWGLNAALTQAAAWRGMGLDGFEIAVNLSARQIHQGDLAETVAMALESSGEAPDRLVLEIPETCATDSASSALFARLSAMGVKLMIDEFGAGYSSFTALKRLPFRGVKLSQTFVRNAALSADDAGIIAAVVAVARGLRLKVTVPGVETSDQWKPFETLDCDRAQGILFARPMNSEATTRALKRGTTVTFANAGS